MRELGCHAFILIQPEHRKKINSCSFEGILVGYSHNSKAYRCYYPKTGRIFVSHNITFIESKDSIPQAYHPRQTSHKGAEHPEDKPEDDPAIKDVVEHLGDIINQNDETKQREVDNEHETLEHTTAPSIDDTDQHIPRHSD